MRAVAIHTSDRPDSTLTHACLLQIVSERVYLVCNVDNPRKPLVSPLAERAALIASVGGVDNLDYFWARQDKTRQQRDRERRAANFDRRPRPHGFPGMIFF